MLFMRCESFDYDFEVAVFAKDYDKYVNDLAEWKVVIVNWALNINFEFMRKSIQSRDIKIASLTQVRDQAMSLWLLDDRKVQRIIEEDDDEEDSELKKELQKLDDLKPVISTWENEVESEVEENSWDEENINNDENIWDVECWICEVFAWEEKLSEYIVKVPSSSPLQIFHDLKDFLSTEKQGEIQIFIEFKGQKRYTNFSIDSLENLQIWEKRFL